MTTKEQLAEAGWTVLGAFLGAFAVGLAGFVWFTREKKDWWQK
jgi:hypothetical protein